MSNLFYLNSNPELKGKTAGNAIVNNISVDEKMAPLPEPITNGLINVTKDFKWTKTIRNDINVSQIPTLSLTEYYITQPAFLSNLGNMLAVIPNAVKGLAKNTGVTAGVKTLADSIREGIGNLENSSLYQDSVGENLKNPLVQSVKGSVASGAGAVAGAVAGGVNSVLQGLALQGSGIDVGSAAYMKAYEDIYGVLKSNFRYRIPFFTKDWKSITTKFADDNGDSKDSNLISRAVGKIDEGYDFVKNIGDRLTTGFAMDFAKSYNYGSENPETKINFILDNTYDSFTDKEGVPSYQKNWELIFLLLYQNLPNKRNRLFFDPPVIYRADVPGVFHYLYSYMSKLEVTALGNTQPRKISLNIKDNKESTDNKQSTETLIPEAFNVSITLKSLLPETKNLFLNSYNTSVTTSTE